ncbi:MAG: carboxylesterase family protein, partial [Arenimonas sp.]
MRKISSRLSLLATALASLLLSGCQQVYFRALNLGISTDAARSVQFDAAHGLWLDVYAPKNASAPAPVVIFFYGGSWRDGDRAFYRFVGEALSRNGVLVVIPDYRKAPAAI